jgi:hypothetical protein
MFCQREALMDGDSDLETSILKNKKEKEKELEIFIVCFSPFQQRTHMDAFFLFLVLYEAALGCKI